MTQLSDLPRDVHQLVFNKVLSSNPSFNDIESLLHLKLKSSVFRNVGNVAEYMVKFFEKGTWNHRRGVIIWHRKDKEGNTMKGVVSFRDPMPGVRVELVNDQREVLAYAMWSTESTLVGNRMHKAWAVAFTVAVNNKYRDLDKWYDVTNFILPIETNEQNIALEAFFVMMKPPSSLSPSYVAPVAPRSMSPRSRCLAEGERVIQNRRRELKQREQQLTEGMLGHDAAVRTFLKPKSATKAIQSESTRKRKHYQMDADGHVIYNSNRYKVHVGRSGGKHILVNGKKVYIKV